MITTCRPAMTKRKATSLIGGFIICLLMNLGTDLTVAQVPVAGDIMNTGIDLLLGIIQTGIVYEFKKYGIEYTPND